LKENAPQSATTEAPAAPATGIVSSVTETVKAAVSAVVPEGPKTWATLFKQAPAPKPEPAPKPVEK